MREVYLRVATREADLVNNREMPDICLQHMVAVTIIDGTPSLAAAHDKRRMLDVSVLSLREKVKLVPDPELEKKLLARIAIVEIALNNGNQLHEQVDAVRGTAENPMTRDEAVAKCAELIRPILGNDHGSKIVDAILNLDHLKDVRQLRPLFQTG